MSRHVLAAAIACVLSVIGTAAPASAQFYQCVAYAREATGIEIRGNANTWWGQADGRYDRGSTPRPGAILAFRSTRSMPAGHVAVVSEVVSAREVLLDHANWSHPGQVEHGVRAVDVSESGDWSEVRVYYAQTGDLGTRTNPAFGFIYPDAPSAPSFAAKPLLGEDVIQLASLEAR